MAPSPVCIVCVGMAGSGKTTFMQRINAHLHAQKSPPYVINLDPAVQHVGFETQIDIRDTIKYKEVMKEYNLGPNGGILTSLNLFATKVDQILAILEKRCKPGKVEGQVQAQQPPSNIIIDTPGQIEVFVWSASGNILLSSLASAFPTVLAYIIDTPRTASTSTFMSNMLYACSILYKTKLPMILVFNKTDVKSADFAKEWMTDFEAFQAALTREENGGAFTGEGSAPGGTGYMGSLLNSMSLMLEEFYKHLRVVGVSSTYGTGIDEFFEAVQEKAAEFESDYRPELERQQAKRQQEKSTQREQDLGQLMKDLNVDQSKPKPTRRKEAPETISDLEDNDEDENEDAQGMVDPDDDDDEDMDDDDDDDEHGRQSLQDRYSKAGQQSHISSDDASFIRYIQKANIDG